MNFQVDDNVEVMKLGDGFEVSYFPGQIIQILDGGFVVDDGFLADLDVVEMVQEADLRPRPFKVEADLVVGDIVDAFFVDAWRKGVLIEVTEEEDGFYGVVFFERRITNKSKRFPIGNIRIHQDFDAMSMTWSYVKK